MRSPMELILIRHALPVSMQSGDGSPVDPHLAPEGVAQAEALAHWWGGRRLDRLYASPLRRARETAAPLARAVGLEVELEPGVVEFDRDAGEYIPLEDLKRNDYPRWKAFVDGALDEVVDLVAFRDTVLGALERIIADNAGRRVAVVCHGGVINTYAAKVLGLEPRLFFDPYYTSLNRVLAAGSGERNIKSLNETPHLEALDEGLQ